VNCVAEANMLYLETPIGVGFSYAKGSSAYTTTVNDEETGIYIYSLLNHLFGTKNVSL
jgi:carboxypeptidase C (cathepsin A)